MNLELARGKFRARCWIISAGSAIPRSQEYVRRIACLAVFKGFGRLVQFVIIPAFCFLNSSGVHPVGVQALARGMESQQSLQPTFCRLEPELEASNWDWG